MSRRSDRWMTPGVAAVLVLCGTVVVLAVLAAVTYLTARGFDPQPVVQLAGSLVAAVAAVGNVVLQLINRRTQAKVERNTGVLAANVADTLDELDRERGRHASPET